MSHLPYAGLIKEYSNLVNSRLSFHKKHTTAMPGGDLNFNESHLQSDDLYLISTDIFDQLENIIKLSETIISTMSFHAATEHMPAGHCRLTPAPLLIVDSSLCYDFLVKVLFKLHNSFPADVLEGHRTRFNTAHKKLKIFYDRCALILFVKQQINIPKIPEHPPDFLKSAGFKETKELKQDVKIIEDDSMSLISVDDIFSVDTPVEPVRNDNVLVPQLLEEIEHLKSQLARRDNEHREEIMTLFGAVTDTENKLRAKDLEIEELKARIPDRENLSKQAEGMQKMYEMIKEKYQKLCQDHANLLNKNQASERELNRMRVLLEEKVDTGEIVKALSLRARQIVLKMIKMLNFFCKGKKLF